MSSQLMEIAQLQIFDRLPAPPWKTLQRGNGHLQAMGDSLRFTLDGATADAYSNAQIDDYQGLHRRDFLWRPPLEMTVSARFSHPAEELRGTAGFGFWNDPFMMTERRRPTLPRAAWFFFASPPSNMKLASGVPGFGWKAATIDVLRPSFFALLPLAPIAIPLMNIPAVYRACWPIAQRAIGTTEKIITETMTDWHTYRLQWQKSAIRFFVDDVLLLESATSPRGPLGFVMWFDNQFMVVTPQGRFKSGLVKSVGRQWMEVNKLEIAP